MVKSFSQFNSAVESICYCTLHSCDIRVGTLRLIIGHCQALSGDFLDFSESILSFTCFFSLENSKLRSCTAKKVKKLKVLARQGSLLIVIVEQTTAMFVQ